jgi:hypothetical protein
MSGLLEAEKAKLRGARQDARREAREPGYLARRDADRAAMRAAYEAQPTNPLPAGWKRGR